ncbi:MAG: hypothetical protein JJ975_04155 [Bacteroidia bacterium]|nr:hypothetical protein [Bacteroidia bacterium]
MTISVCLIWGCSQPPDPDTGHNRVEVFEKYYPLKFDGDNFVVRDSHIDRSQAIRVALVLGYYDIPIRTNHYNEIQIPKWLNEDKEFLYNISNKSMDSIWFYEHITTSEGFRIIENP